MLKIKLPKSEFDALPEAIRAEYQLVGTEYVLHTDIPVEDVRGLKSALESEKVQRLAATTRVQTLEQENAGLRTAQTGNVAALEDSWKKKVADQEAHYKAELKKTEDAAHRILVDEVVNRIAAQVNPKHPNLVVPHIKDRVTLERRPDGQFITRILDKQGQPSAASENEFFAEVIANPDLAPIVVRSNASGGGANGGGSKTKNPPGGKGFNELSESERTTLYRTNKPEYDRLKAEAKTK